MTDSYAVELIHVVKKFGEVTAVDDMVLQVHDGEFFSLLGPSGCGKTTTLRLIAGFEVPTSGEVRIGGEPQGYLPAYKRPVNTVFQHYALFPHMTVFKNVAFGLDMKGVPEDEINTRVMESLEMVHLERMENRWPKQLSGGQKQRVALARALVNKPKVLLLDEPLGALDLKLRKNMQVELKALQDQVGITFIYVTHDQEEALTMSDRIGVMNLGVLLQIGTAREVYEAPESRFVSDFIGDTNYLQGQVNALNGSMIEVRLHDETIARGGITPGLQVGNEVTLAFRPEKVILNPETHPDINLLSNCTVTGVIFSGALTTYELLTSANERLIAREQNTVGKLDSHFQPGDTISIGWPTASCKVFID